MVLVRNINEYIGTNAERIAMNTTELNAGSIFEETDTGIIYKWSGSAWFVSGTDNVSINSALPAGTNIIGKVGIDQTTPGTTNGVQLTAGTNHVGKTGYTLKRISTSFTRPSDTDQYAIGDAITNSTSAPVVFELDLASVGAVAGQAVEIRKIAVVSSAKQSTLPLVNVYLSNATFTATNDNAALDIADATMEAGGSWIVCDVQNYTASNSRVAKPNANEPMILASEDTKLYGTLQAANAYTPVSEEKFTVIVWVALL